MTEAPNTEPDEGDLVTKSYTIATSRLRKEYPQRFNELRVEAAKELGFEWAPKPDPEDLARRDIEAHLAQFPRLRELFAQAGAEGQPAGTEGA